MERSPIDSQQMLIKKSGSAFPFDNSEESLSGVQLPLELISEILVRLPVKSLLKSKCVSKSWLCLISSPEFIKSHFSLSSSREGQYSNHRLLFTTLSPKLVIKGCFLNSTLHNPSTHVFDFECPFLKPDSDSISIVGMVNGLICLSLIDDKEIFVWNPVLRKSKRFPSPNVSIRKHGGYAIYGFGYDESNDDYKVVSVQCVYHTSGACQTEVNVYSLLADSWRKIEDFKGGIPWDVTGKYFNGKIHWTAIESIPLCGNWKIVTLDMVTEKFGELQRPCYVNADGGVLGVLGGRLFLRCDYNLTKKVDLWVMDKHGVEECWSKVASIPYVYVNAFAPKPRPLCILRNGEIVLANGSCLVVYHPKHNEFRNIELGGCNLYLDALVYAESLVWPNES